MGRVVGVKVESVRKPHGSDDEVDQNAGVNATCEDEKSGADEAGHHFFDEDLTDLLSEELVPTPSHPTIEVAEMQRTQATPQDPYQSRPYAAHVART